MLLRELFLWWILRLTIRLLCTYPLSTGKNILFFGPISSVSPRRMVRWAPMAWLLLEFRIRLLILVFENVLCKRVRPVNKEERAGDGRTERKELKLLNTIFLSSLRPGLLSETAILLQMKKERRQTYRLMPQGGFGAPYAP